MKPLRLDGETRSRESQTLTLAVCCQVLGLPAPTFEYRFHPTRKWRIDLAWVEQRLAVEVEGGVFVQGRHTRGKAFEDDCEKYAELAIAGWTLMRVTSDQVKRGEAANWIRRWFEARGLVSADWWITPSGRHGVEGE